MKMRLEININYIPSIIHLLEINSSILNNKHYHGMQQYSGEMVIVCSLIVTFTYKYLIFLPDTFWEWIKYNIDIITIIYGQWKYLLIQNHQHYNGSQQDSGDMTLLLLCLTFYMKYFGILN